MTSDIMQYLKTLLSWSRRSIFGCTTLKFLFKSPLLTKSNLFHNFTLLSCTQFGFWVISHTIHNFYLYIFILYFCSLSKINRKWADSNRTAKQSKYDAARCWITNWMDRWKREIVHSFTWTEIFLTQPSNQPATTHNKTQKHCMDIFACLTWKNFTIFCFFRFIVYCKWWSTWILLPNSLKIGIQFYLQVHEFNFAHFS